MSRPRLFYISASRYKKYPVGFDQTAPFIWIITSVEQEVYFKQVSFYVLL